MDHHLNISPLFWILFNAFIIGLLLLDMGVFHKKAHVIKVKEAMLWSCFWISLALVFNVILYFWLGGAHALDFFTGYLLEKSLSVDNVFVFAVIFKYFQVPPANQHRVLFFGIMGALVMRAIFIFAGIAILQHFHWTIYVFGAFLVITGYRMAFRKEDGDIHPDQNPLVVFIRKYLPIHPKTNYEHFFVKENGKWWATSLFIVLIVVETTDLVFAVDSIPAILAITQNSFIVYTSNVFAILGLRSLYFALAGMMDLFHHLHYALAGILTFVGVKMLVSSFIKIPNFLSIGIIIGTLILSVITSRIFPKKTNS